MRSGHWPRWGPGRPATAPVGESSSGGSPSGQWTGGLSGLGGHILASDYCHFLPLHPCSVGWKGWGFSPPVPAEGAPCPGHQVCHGNPAALSAILGGPHGALLLSLSTAQLCGPEHKARNHRGRALGVKSLGVKAGLSSGVQVWQVPCPDFWLLICSVR